MNKMVKLDYYSCTEYDIILLLSETEIFRLEILYKIMKVIIERNYLTAHTRLMDMYRQSNIYQRSTLGLFGTRINHDICSTIDVVMKLDNNYCLRRICKLGRMDMFNNIPNIYLSVGMGFHCIKLVSSYLWYMAVRKFIACINTLLEIDDTYKKEIMSHYANISQLLTRRGKHQYIGIIRQYIKSISVDEDDYY